MSDQEQIETLKAWAHWKRLELNEYAARQSTDAIWESWDDVVNSIQFALARIQELEAESEQLRVQLGGCGVAALGWNKESAKQGDYGWSASYQEVLNLRRKYEASEVDNARLKLDIKLGNAAIIYIDDTPEPREGGE